MPVTLKDIAAKLGTTHCTVSRALQDNPQISKSMRQRIKQLAEELGYKPNLLSRGLKGGRTRTIGILWSLCAPHASVETRMIALRVFKHNHVTYLADSLGDPMIINQALDDYIQRRVDGVVLEYPSIWSDTGAGQEVLERFPGAVVVTAKQEPIQIDQVIHDRLNSWRAVADHFVKSGRKYPGLIVSSPHNADKAEAFIDRFRLHGIKIPSQWTMLTKGETAHDVYNILEQRFPLGKPSFDALMCGTDEWAMVAMRWLNKKGLRVPQDVAVVGFNNSEISEFTSPLLASVDRRDEEVADAVEKMLFARLENPELPAQVTEVSMKFVWRESADRGLLPPRYITEKL